ncbi:MAG TPA: beta-galactosidase [Clostridiaceae bacterium]
MNIGTAYYPEYRNEIDWPGDFELIRNAGIKRIRIGEFAWSKIQPGEGVFDFEWMDRSIEMAGKYGIGVVIGTPTAVPPIWLVEKYPDVLPVNNEGRKSDFGARQHHCFNSEDYIHHSEMLVEALAKRYGSNSNVVAWQIDNELGAEQKRCFCDNCKKKFKQFLLEKYKTISELNARWGNHFWSEDYQNFNQIRLPDKYASDLTTKNHPSLELEFSRFSSDSIIDFCMKQANIIRKYSINQIVTTNTDMFVWGDNLNLYKLYRDLDLCAIDVYSDKPYEIGFYSDLARSLKGSNFWMGEFNSANSNLSNEMMQVKNCSCEWFFLFKFNSFPWGQEQGNGALITMTGKTTENYNIVKRWSEDKKALDNIHKNSNSVGIMYDFDSSWTYTIASWDTDVEKKQVYSKYLINCLYKSLFEENIRIEFVFTKDTFEKLSTIILPFKAIYDPDLEEALILFVQNGGLLIINSDFFIKNEDNVYLTSVPKIYKIFFGAEQDDFVLEERGPRDIIIKHASVSKGQVLMVRNDTNVQEWKEIIHKYCCL